MLSDLEVFHNVSRRFMTKLIRLRKSSGYIKTDSAVRSLASVTDTVCTLHTFLFIVMYFLGGVWQPPSRGELRRTHPLSNYKRSDKHTHIFVRDVITCLYF